MGLLITPGLLLLTGLTTWAVAALSSWWLLAASAPKASTGPAHRVSASRRYV